MTDDRGLGPLEIEPPGGPDRYGKVRARSSSASPTDDEPVTAVVEVAAAGYRPSTVDVRAELTDTLFTARIRPSELEALDSDPLVVSIELGGPS